MPPIPSPVVRNQNTLPGLGVVLLIVLCLSGVQAVRVTKRRRRGDDAASASPEANPEAN